MEKLGVELAGDSRDTLGRIRFHPFVPAMHIKENYPTWYFDYIKQPPVKVISNKHHLCKYFFKLYHSNLLCPDFCFKL